MQLAPISTAMTSPAIAGRDVVSPRALFAAASRSITHSLQLLSGSENFAPNAEITRAAIRHAEVGLNTLRAVLVPSTPFSTKQVAAAAMDRTRDAVLLLTDYEAVTRQTHLTGPVRRDELSPQQLRSLDVASQLLLSATGKLA